jgi:hypothetical protein
MGREIQYVITEFTVLWKHSSGGTVGSHKKPQDITASNTSNNGNEHLPNTSLNQLQKVSTMIRHNYSTTIRDLFLKASYRRKLLWSVHLFQINFQEIIWIKTVKTVILLTIPEINRAPQTVLIQTTYTDQIYSCATFKFTLLEHHQTM